MATRGQRLSTHKRATAWPKPEHRRTPLFHSVVIAAAHCRPRCGHTMRRYYGVCIKRTAAPRQTTSETRIYERLCTSALSSRPSMKTAGPHIVLAPICRAQTFNRTTRSWRAYRRIYKKKDGIRRKAHPVSDNDDRSACSRGRRSFANGRALHLRLCGCAECERRQCDWCRFGAPRFAATQLRATSHGNERARRCVRAQLRRRTRVASNPSTYRRLWLRGGRYRPRSDRPGRLSAWL